MLTRRKLIMSAASGTALAGLSGLIPTWAKTAGEGNLGVSAQRQKYFDLKVGKFSVTINGRAGNAIGVNGTMPAPLLRFKEGEEITLDVTNGLGVDTSIHWHGLLVPFQMDGVPGVTYPGIKPGQTFKYKFAVPQAGTYWYHSHSGLQEQSGHYGPIIIDPKDTDPVHYDREYVMVLSDWSFEDPHRIFAKLKSMSGSFNQQKHTAGQVLSGERSLSESAMWGGMRMSSTDISDVTGASYTYLINGRGTADNWNGVARPGERVRLRIINASAMTIFNVRMPGMPMTIVAADGLNVQPLEVDEFQMGVAETYDVIIEPKDENTYAFVAESIDRSGQVVASFGPRAGVRAAPPPLRERPTLTMKDMGMDHAKMGHGDMGDDDMDHANMDHSKMDMGEDDAPDDAPMDHSTMEHSTMDHSKMNHDDMDMNKMNMPAMKTSAPPPLRRGPGVANINMNPISRLDEPGAGLENMPHRVLRYSQLRSLAPKPDTRAPSREIILHLTSNMERYMWSFNGVKFAHVKEAIKMTEGERVRMTLINNTMMPHPIHLHGMFFDLLNGGGDHAPRKHTVIVKPAEKLSYDVTADNVGDWAFHCHLLYHMHAGMMQVVSVLPRPMIDHSKMPVMDHSKMDHSKMDHGNMGGMIK